MADCVPVTPEAFMRRLADLVASRRYDEMLALSDVMAEVEHGLSIEDYLDALAAR